MLDAARAAGTRRFVLASTGGAIYGDCDRLPTPEDAPPPRSRPTAPPRPPRRPTSRSTRRLHGLSTVALRFANVYGPRQDPLGEGGVVAIYCHAAANSRQVRVFGDGRQTRDFVYVGDVAAALHRGGRQLDVTGAYNVGTGEETSVLDLVERLGLEPTLRARAAGRGRAVRARPERGARGAGVGAPRWRSTTGSSARCGPRTTKGARRRPSASVLLRRALAAVHPLAVARDHVAAVRGDAVAARARS